MENLLILSQVVLSLQLGFAVVPLIHFVSSKKLMGEFVAPKSLIFLGWMTAAIILLLNGKLIYDTICDWMSTSENPTGVWFATVPISILTGLLLLWITFRPLIGKAFIKKNSKPHDVPKHFHLTPKENYSKIAVCVDFSSSDNEALSRAIQQGGKTATYLLIHITESAGARVMKSETGDFETQFDQKALNDYSENLRDDGYTIEVELGFGNPKETIPQIVNASEIDLLVMGAHGHSWLKDLLFGTTVESVRHKVKVPVLIVRM